MDPQPIIDSYNIAQHIKYIVRRALDGEIGQGSIVYSVIVGVGVEGEVGRAGGEAKVVEPG